MAHLHPDEIILEGEGVFPRLGFNISSQLSDPNNAEYETFAELRKKTFESLKISGFKDEEYVSKNNN